MDESEHLAAAAGGSGGEPPDEQAFKENAAFVRRAVIERLGPAAVVDEIVHEVLFRYLRTARKADRDEVVREFLLALTSNVCDEYARSNSQDPRLMKVGSMNGNHTTSRWLALGRAMLFMVGCAVILAMASPVGAKLSGQWPEVVTGVLGSLGAFGLTLLFVRWERLSLADVGAAIDRRSVLRLAFGCALGVRTLEISAGCVEIDVRGVDTSARGVEIDARGAEISARGAEIDLRGAEISARCVEISATTLEISARCVEPDARGVEISARGTEIDSRDAEISARCVELDARGAEIDARSAEISARRVEIDARGAEISARGAEINARGAEIDGRGAEISARCVEIDARGAEIDGPGAAIDTLRVRIGGPSADHGP